MCTRLGSECQLQDVDHDHHSREQCCRREEKNEGKKGFRVGFGCAFPSEGGVIGEFINSQTPQLSVQPPSEEQRLQWQWK